MIAKTIEIEGTLQADGSLVLDENPSLPPGRVRVALQPIGVAGTPDLIAVLDAIHAAQVVRGHAPRTREEIDAAIAEMRGEDEERMRGIERLHEECERARKPGSAAEQS